MKNEENKNKKIKKTWNWKLMNNRSFMPASDCSSLQNAPLRMINATLPSRASVELRLSMLLLGLLITLRDFPFLSSFFLSCCPVCFIVYLSDLINLWIIYEPTAMPNNECRTTKISTPTLITLFSHITFPNCKFLPLILDKSLDVNWERCHWWWKTCLIHCCVRYFMRRVIQFVESECITSHIKEPTCHSTKICAIFFSFVFFPFSSLQLN